jgi:hypothetical protein
MSTSTKAENPLSFSRAKSHSRPRPNRSTSAATEEVKVTGRTVDHVCNHERRATGEGESVRLGQPGHDASHPLLQRAQHATATPRRFASHLDQADRTRGGSTSSGHRSISSSTSM